MPALPRQGRVRVREDGAAHVLEADGDEIGRIEGGEVEVGQLEAVVEDVGLRLVLRSGRARVLRLDPGGGKATTLTLTRTRYRLAKQKWLPGRRQWILRDDVGGDDVLTVTSTPLGTTVAMADTDGIGDRELELLVAGALVVALDAGPDA